MKTDETIDQLKLKGFKVFKLNYPGGLILYREATLEETLYLDRVGDSENIRMLPIVRSVILDIEGELTVDKLDGFPNIVKEIIKTIRDNSRFTNKEKVIQEYQKINREMDDNFLDTLVFWVSKQLAYPEFMYVSKNMSPPEFMRHVVMAENISGLNGFFMYSLTDDEQHLSEQAKHILFPERYQADQRPLWQQAGLPHPPMNIREKAILKEFIKNMKAGQAAPGPEHTPPTVAPAGVDITTQMAIQRASKILSQQVRADEAARAAGKERPAHFDWQRDAAAEGDAEL